MSEVYEEYRKKILVELSKIGVLDSYSLMRVLGAIDYVSSGYEMTEKEKGLIVPNSINQDLLTQYLADCNLQGQAEGTIQNKYYYLNEFFNIITTPVPEITANDIRKYLYVVRQRTSDVTEENARKIVNSFFEFCVNEDVILKNPCHKIKRVHCPKKEIQPLNEKEFELLRGAALSKREKALIEFMYSSGARVSEVSNVKIDDLNFDTGEVQLYGKGKKYRKAFISSTAKEAILNYLDLRHDECPYVFVSYRKQDNEVVNLSTRAIRDELHKVGDRASVKVNPHQIRHTTATNLQKSMSIQNISSYLGHEDISTTMIYAKVNRSAMKDEFNHCMEKEEP